MDLKGDPPKPSFWKRMSRRLSKDPRKEELPSYSQHPGNQIPGYQQTPYQQPPYQQPPYQQPQYQQQPPYQQSAYQQPQYQQQTPGPEKQQRACPLESPAYEQQVPAYQPTTVKPAAPPDPVPAAAAPPAAQPIEEDEAYMILEYQNHNLWPWFKPNEGNLLYTIPQPILDFDDPLRKKWAAGKSIGNNFGSRFFPARSSHPQSLPLRLFDLEQNRVVFSSGISQAAGTEYVVVSHVWGDTRIGIPGTQYGVDWDISVQSAQKLEQIMTACRAIGGIRYMWMDILCLDQRTRNPAEIANMGAYFENAAGCIVWLDNAYGDADWGRVLSSIESTNRIYRLSKSGLPPVSARQYQQQENKFSVPLDPAPCFRMMRAFLRIEKAPWFKRLWTLQEGILPERVVFVTPERYMVDRSALFQLAQTFAMIANYTIEQGMGTGVGILQEMQRSEIWKMLKLKHLYSAKQMSYQHIFHATKSRTCKLEQDRLFGVLGLIREPKPPVDYSRSLQDLYREYYRLSVECGDFSSLLFLGGSIWHTPESMAVILPPGPAGSISPASPTNHQLRFLGDGPSQNQLELRNVGYDTVAAVHCLTAKGTLRYWLDSFPNFLLVDPVRASQIVRAWGLPDTSAVLPNGSLGPGYIAAMMGKAWDAEERVRQYGEEFYRQYKLLAPRVDAKWFSNQWLEMRIENAATVVLWTTKSGPQLAVVTEALDKLDGSTVTVMPRSYVDQAGPSCLICVRDGETWRKVGIGMGDALRAAAASDFVLS